MREILFRGKSVISDAWAYGTPIFYTATNKVVMCKEYELNHNVIPETVGQHTGLKDKNGERIFEGDIAKHDDYIFVVKYGKCGGVPNDVNYGYMGFYVDGYDGQTKRQIHLGLRQDICYFKNIEVIGNIHDNPELLEEELT